MLDNKGKPLAYFYDQRRITVKSSQINQTMKDAIISVEDRRFYEHSGVDYKGTARALFGNIKGGETQGGSTLNQQLIKNIRLLTADNEQDQASATARSYTRKIVEARLAQELDGKMNKEQILTTYLNVVPFGNHAYGIEVAALTYFGKSAKDLTVPESAMLAGIVKASEYYNPYVREAEVVERRNTVLRTMRDNNKITPSEYAKYLKAPLGILPKPSVPAEGCTGATDGTGYYCAYIIGELEKSGITVDEVKTGGLNITTSLDRHTQKLAVDAISNQVNPKAHNVAGVINIIKPGAKSHDIIAMASSRKYGVNEKAKESVVELPFSQVGDGAGSTFKIFSAAAAMEKGIGIKTSLPVPARVEVSGLGTGGAPGCPEGKYCVVNAGSYASNMTLQTALSESPNTTFVKLTEFAGLDETVNMAQRLGLRSYGAKKGIGTDIKQNRSGAFTLGFTPVNPLEMANVSATLASSGIWCEPRGVLNVTDRNKAPRKLAAKPCEQAVPAGLADSLSVGLSDDTISGTAAAGAKSVGFSGPLAGKTGTTEAHKSAAFVGFNNKAAGFSYVFSDGRKTAPICTGPARTCDYGDIYGGNEPAQSLLTVFNSLPGGLPKASPPYINGSTSSSVPDVKGMNTETAIDLLSSLGFKVDVNGPLLDSRVTKQSVTGSALPGSEISITTKSIKRERTPDRNNRDTDRTRERPDPDVEEPPIIVDPEPGTTIPPTETAPTTTVPETSAPEESGDTEVTIE